MKLQFFAILAMVVLALAQGVTDKIAPPGEAPAGCEPSRDGEFELTVIRLNNNNNAKRDLALENRAACSGSGSLVVRLAGGVLTDARDRAGYTSSSFQFQFDNPPQAGALFTAGFSACANGSLALGGTTVFWQCASGTFWNLYDRCWAPQCEPVHLRVVPCGSRGGGGGGTVVGTQAVTTTAVVGPSDGQPQAATATGVIYVCQIDDGQIQAHTAPCTAAPPTPAVSIPPASQYPGGPVETTPAPATPPASESGEQETESFTPAVVPTDAPLAGAAAGGHGGSVGTVVVAALGAAWAAWF